jgi:hypothetical protein
LFSEYADGGGDRGRYVDPKRYYGTCNEGPWSVLSSSSSPYKNENNGIMVNNGVVCAFFFRKA